MRMGIWVCTCVIVLKAKGDKCSSLLGISNFQILLKCVVQTFIEKISVDSKYLILRLKKSKPVAEIGITSQFLNSNNHKHLPMAVFK